MKLLAVIGRSINVHLKAMEFFSRLSEATTVALPHSTTASRYLIQKSASFSHKHLASFCEKDNFAIPSHEFQAE